MHESEALAADICEAMRVGVHLQLCHEFPSVLDAGSARRAFGFKEIMEATPPNLKEEPRNIYSQIAIPLKGGELREVGLANLARRLAMRVARAPIAEEQRSPARKNSQTASTKGIALVKVESSG